MERAIQNILVNAIRYSPSGELIRISLSETHGTIRGEIETQVSVCLTMLFHICLKPSTEQIHLVTVIPAEAD